MSLKFREALEKDLPLMMGTLSDEELVLQRKDIAKPLNPPYLSALMSIVAYANNGLIVVDK